MALLVSVRFVARFAACFEERLFIARIMRVKCGLCQQDFFRILLLNFEDGAHCMRMSAPMRRKNRYETAVAVNITLPPLLHQKLQEIVHRRGFTGASAYVQERIRLDSGLALSNAAPEVR